MRAKKVYESIGFERGRDPKSSIGIGMKEYIKSLDWPTTNYSLENGWLDNPDLEMLEYKGFTILLRPEEKFPKGFPVNNPWNSDDIWHGMCNSRKDIGEIGAHTRGPGREAVLKNIKKSINYRLRKTTESLEFERGRDPKEAMNIGAIHDAVVIDSMQIEYRDKNGKIVPVMSYSDYLDADENTWLEIDDDSEYVHYVLQNWEDEANYSMNFEAHRADVEDPEEDTEFWHAPELEGELVIWEGKVYKIPKTNKFGGK